jgi:alpha-L-arabinofuranosidase
LILKLVNLDSSLLSVQITLHGDQKTQPQATQTVLAGDPKAFNTLGNPGLIIPRASSIQVAKPFALIAPPHSLTVLRMMTK